MFPAASYPNNMQERVRLYELMAANKLDRREKAEQWRWSGILDKVFQPHDQIGLRQNRRSRFQARGK